MAVMYHYVRPRDPLMSDGVVGLTPAAFETQLDRLCRFMEPIDWPTLFAWSEGRMVIPSRCFLLTFDDGLKDHAAQVAPILDRRGIRGTFFVAGQALSEYRLICGHAVHLLLGRLGTERLSAELSRYLESRYAGEDWVGVADERAAVALYAYETPERARLKYLLHMVLPGPVRREALAALFEAHVGSPRRWAKAWYLSWEELAELQHAGHTIGGHGFSHEPLARLSASEQRTDLVRAAAVLNDGLGRDIRPVSYPFGRYDDHTMAASREAGFVHGFTTERAMIDHASSPFTLPRVDTIHVEEAIQTFGLDELTPKTAAASSAE
jgi:peptidoglycan/xylan/chitin deacetylase (PgdA/CDA1 family)